jgi:hypothetical protein
MGSVRQSSEATQNKHWRTCGTRHVDISLSYERHKRKWYLVPVHAAVQVCHYFRFAVNVEVLTTRMSVLRAAVQSNQENQENVNGGTPHRWDPTHAKTSGQGQAQSPADQLEGNMRALPSPWLQ